MLYLFDDTSLLFTLAGCFLAGFIPLFIMFIRCPEARVFVKAQLTGGVVISDSDDSGQVVFRVAKPLGSGQYISGPNKYRQRTIYVVPRINNPFIAKRFFLSGIRRPIFHHYGGKTVAVNDETLAAIEIADLNDQHKSAEIPKNVKEWAKTQGFSLSKDSEDDDGHLFEQPEEPEEAEVKEGEPSEPTIPEKIKKKFKNIVAVTLFTVDPRKLRYFFDSHYDESQYDVLLDQARQDGANQRGGGFNMNKIGLFLVIVLVIAAVGILGMGIVTGAIHL
jgi:hypothetical protein